MGDFSPHPMRLEDNELVYCLHRLPRGTPKVELPTIPYSAYPKAVIKLMVDTREDNLRPEEML